MRVKIGDRIYDSLETPLCVELTDAEKEVVNGMAEGENRLAVFPEDCDPKEIQTWMHAFGDAPESED